MKLEGRKGIVETVILIRITHWFCTWWAFKMPRGFLTPNHSNPQIWIDSPWCVCVWTLFSTLFFHRIFDRISKNPFRYRVRVRWLNWKYRKTTRIYVIEECPCSFYTYVYFGNNQRLMLFLHFFFRIDELTHRITSAFRDTRVLQFCCFDGQINIFIGKLPWNQHRI